MTETPGSIKQTRVRSAFQKIEQNLQANDVVELAWRAPDKNDESFKRWIGTCLGDDEDGKHIMRWDGFDAPAGDVLFPPEEPLRYASIILRRGANRRPIFELHGEPLSPKKKRVREEPGMAIVPQELQLLRSQNDLLQSQHDIASGHKTLLSPITAGLRMNTDVCPEDRWLLPHLWRDQGESLVQLIKEKFISAGCFTKTTRLDLELTEDYDILVDLLCLPRVTKRQLRVLYIAHWRILEKFFITCPIFINGTSVADSFMKEALLNWDEGRIDTVALFNKYRRKEADKVDVHKVDTPRQENREVTSRDQGSDNRSDNRNDNRRKGKNAFRQRRQKPPFRPYQNQNHNDTNREPQQRTATPPLPRH